MNTLIDPRRVRHYNQTTLSAGPILYWMHREFRAKDNWGLLHARQVALLHGRPVAAVFCLAPTFLDATIRHYDFLLKGLEETARHLHDAGIPLLMRWGDPAEEIVHLCTEIRPALVVTDFDPLRIKRRWLQELTRQHQFAVDEVDSRNIVPAWVASDHREFMAKTFRPRLHRHLADFCRPFPELAPHPIAWPRPIDPPDFTTLRTILKVDTSVQPVAGRLPGEAAAHAVMAAFLEQRLGRYDRRNDPNANACSGLSPYLHFGMIASQSIVLAIRERRLTGDNVESFLEELVVRRELSDNYCLYTPQYDQMAGFPEWAQRTLAQHRRDKRQYLYTEDQFEWAATHDPLWNAAQHQLLTAGTIHSYLRMYWAKKILEWSAEPAEALRIAIRLNDRYALDGRDTNGYTGIAWSIGGVHDRGWSERPIFGTIRYMNEAGARRKFNVNQYLRTWLPEQPSLFPAPGQH